MFFEIGGNDVFGPTTVNQFEKDLDQLLAEVSSPGRQVMMLELPLPPFYNGFGLAQRRLARQHNVLLVPGDLSCPCWLRKNRHLIQYTYRAKASDECQPASGNLCGRRFRTSDGP